MNIVLIGMRGSGKNTVGKLLSDKLNKPYIEVDKLVVSKVKMPIKEFVRKFGWNKFREIETKIMKDLANNKVDNVISTGGGVVEDEQNLCQFQKNSDVIIWLKCSLDIIIARIGNNTNIPFITSAKNFEDDLRKVYERRKDLYPKYADITISSEEDTETISKNIITKLAERNIL